MEGAGAGRVKRARPSHSDTQNPDSDEGSKLDWLRPQTQSQSRNTQVLNPDYRSQTAGSKDMTQVPKPDDARPTPDDTDPKHSE